MSSYILRSTSSAWHDVEVVGGKNASLGEMISHLARLRCRCRTASPRRRRHIAISSPQDGLATRIAEALRELDVEDVDRLARPARGSAAGFCELLSRSACSSEVLERLRAHERRARNRRRSALFGDRRRSSRGVLRRPAGNVPQRARSRRAAQVRARSITRRCSTIAPSPIACIKASLTTRSRCRPACSTWCGAISAPAA